MYHKPGMSPCSILLHILMKHPIFVLGMGLAAAVIFLNPLITNHPNINSAEASKEFQAKIADLKKAPGLVKLVAEAENKFGEIYKPERLTRGAFNEICDSIPDCCPSYNVVLKDPKKNRDFSRLYFFHLVQKLGSVELAAATYTKEDKVR